MAHDNGDLGLEGSDRQGNSGGAVLCGYALHCPLWKDWLGKAAIGYDPGLSFPKMNIGTGNGT